MLYSFVQHQYSLENKVGSPNKRDVLFMFFFDDGDFV